MGQCLRNALQQPIIANVHRDYCCLILWSPLLLWSVLQARYLSPEMTIAFSHGAFNVMAHTISIHRSLGLLCNQAHPWWTRFVSASPSISTSNLSSNPSIALEMPKELAQETSCGQSFWPALIPISSVWMKGSWKRHKTEEIPSMKNSLVTSSRLSSESLSQRKRSLDQHPGISWLERIGDHAETCST